jgi:L-amino acid N-acyltransferase YncA
MIRSATPADAAALTAIYNPYIAATTISFEETAVSVEEMAHRIETITAKLPWYVYEIDGQVIGYAYATSWRARPAYQRSVETSVYVSQQHPRKGIGKQLYRALLEDLRGRNFHVAIGGIAMPNAASIALHESLGYRKVAHFPQVGRKFDQWLDVGYWQLLLNGQDI